MSEEWLTVGRIVNTHGVRGEVKIYPQTDFPELRFGKGSRLTLFEEKSGARIPLEVTGSRQQKNVYIVKFKGLDNINDVEKYKNSLLKVEASDRAQLEEGEYYYHEIVGCKVVTDEGEELGTISEILTPGANDVWVVQRPKGKPVLLPVIDDVLLDVDVKAKTVRVHVLEGLI